MVTTSVRRTATTGTRPTPMAVAFVRATGSRFIPATQKECQALVFRFLRAKERRDE